MPKHSLEFDERAGWRDRVWDNVLVTQSIAERSVSLLLEPRGLGVLATAVATVWGIAAKEAKLLCAGAAPTKFVVKYAFENVLPSVVWGTKSPKLVAVAMGLDPTSLLRNLEGRSCAKVLLRVETLRTARSIIAGFMGIAQILRVTGTVWEAADARQSAVRMCRSPPHPVPEGRVIRFVGQDSPSTAASLGSPRARHFVPIVEDPKSPTLRAALDASTYVPVAWHIRDGRYGKTSSWSGFQVHDSWSFTTADNRRVIFAEADSSVSEDALGLGGADRDLSLREAAHGFQQLQRLCPPGVTLVRTLLASADSEVVSGGGNAVKLRWHVEENNEADVLIDTKAPIINSILVWAAAHHPHGTARTIVIHTSDKAYYKSLQDLLALHGWSVVDHWSPKATKDMLHLCHEPKDEDTCYSVRLLSEGGVGSQLVCALVDTAEGREDVEALGCGAHTICAADLYENLFEEVRSLVLRGVDVSLLQSVMDDYVMP